MIFNKDGGNNPQKAAFAGVLNLQNRRKSLFIAEALEPGETVEWYRFRASGKAPKNFGLNLNPVNEGATIEIFAKQGAATGKRLIKLKPTTAADNPVKNGTISGGGIKDLFKDKTLKKPTAGEYLIKITRLPGTTQREGFSLMITPGEDVSGALAGVDIPDVNIPINLPRSLFR
jgi:hypothetical protein